MIRVGPKLRMRCEGSADIAKADDPPYAQRCGAPFHVLNGQFAVASPRALFSGAHTVIQSSS